MKTLATTINDPQAFGYEDYLEFCDINGYTPDEDGSDGFLNWVYEEIALNYECDLQNIRNFKNYNVPVKVTGTLGLWDGRHEIAPAVFDSVYDAIIECVYRADDAEVIWDDGEIIVNAYHHDGVNVFHIGDNLPYMYE